MSLSCPFDLLLPRNFAPFPHCFSVSYHRTYTYTSRSLCCSFFYQHTKRSKRWTTSGTYTCFYENHSKKKLLRLFDHNNSNTVLFRSYSTPVIRIVARRSRNHLEPASSFNIPAPTHARSHTHIQPRTHTSRVPPFLTLFPSLSLSLSLSLSFCLIRSCFLSFSLALPRSYTFTFEASYYVHTPCNPGRIIPRNTQHTFTRHNVGRLLLDDVSKHYTFGSADCPVVSVLAARWLYAPRVFFVRSESQLPAFRPSVAIRACSAILGCHPVRHGGNPGYTQDHRWKGKGKRERGTRAYVRAPRLLFSLSYSLCRCCIREKK